MITPGKELCAYIVGQRNGHPADRFRYADFCGAHFHKPTSGQGRLEFGLGLQTVAAPHVFLLVA